MTEALKSNSGGGWQGHTQLALYWVQNWEDLPHLKVAVAAIVGFRAFTRALVVSPAIPFIQNENTPTIYLGVPALPKGALVEKQVVLHTGRFLVQNEDDTEIRSLEPQIDEGSLSSETASIHWKVSSFAEHGSRCAAVCIKGDVTEQLEAQFHERLPDAFSHALSVRVFYRPSTSLSCMFISRT